MKHTEPEKEAQEHEKRRPKNLFTSLSNRSEIRDVNQRKEDILTKKKKQIIARIFSSKVFKHHPNEEHVKTTPPVVQDGYRGGASRHENGEKNEVSGLICSDHSADLPSSQDSENKEPETDQRLVVYRADAEI
ncbi:MAG TPA: hypothetical protein VIY69_04605 [Candidatus Acidoferrales bacterium]